MTNEMVEAQAALLGGKRFKNTIRIRLKDSFAGCAYYRYIDPDTMAVIVEHSELDNDYDCDGNLIGHRSMK